MGEIERNAGQIRSMVDELKRGLQSAISEIGNVKFNLEKVGEKLQTQIIELGKDVNEKLIKVNTYCESEIT